MRVISGLARGTKLNSIESSSTRPTLDRVKESMFNILQNDIKDKVILDLFAGSGALGIEALSRGAKKAYFCDINSEAIYIIKQNLEKAHLKEKAVIFKKSYIEAISSLDEKIDIVFLDPPYKLGVVGKSIEFLLKKKILTNDVIIVIETDEVDRDVQEIKKIEGINIIDQRKYGRAHLVFASLK